MWAPGVEADTRYISEDSWDIEVPVEDQTRQPMPNFFFFCFSLFFLNTRSFDFKTQYFFIFYNILNFYNCGPFSNGLHRNNKSLTLHPFYLFRKEVLFPG